MVFHLSFLQMSIISKIIDKKYVEIKNIDGIKKESQIVELTDKYKLKEKGSVNLYKIDFDLETSYLGLIEKNIIPDFTLIKFNFNLDTGNKNLMEQIDLDLANISIYPIITNITITLIRINIYASQMVLK